MDRMIKISVRPWGSSLDCWIWCIVNSRDEEITRSRLTYSNEKKAIRAARYYAKKFSCTFFVIGR